MQPPISSPYDPGAGKAVLLRELDRLRDLLKSNTYDPTQRAWIERQITRLAHSARVLA